MHRCGNYIIDAAIMLYIHVFVLYLKKYINKNKVRQFSVYTCSQHFKYHMNVVALINNFHFEVNFKIAFTRIEESCTCHKCALGLRYINK